MDFKLLKTINMKLKKFFNVLNKEQKLVISKETEQIHEIVKSEQVSLDKRYDVDCEKWDTTS